TARATRRTERDEDHPAPRRLARPPQPADGLARSDVRARASGKLPLAGGHSGADPGPRAERQEDEPADPRPPRPRPSRPRRRGAGAPDRGPPGARATRR